MQRSWATDFQGTGIVYTIRQNCLKCMYAKEIDLHRNTTTQL